METQQQDFLSKLAELRAALCDQMPTPQMSVIIRLTARLRRSGLLTRALQVGETAPDFSFGQGSLYGLLEKGPVVINFYRGLWCSVCRTEMEAYEAIRDQLQSCGCSYLGVSPQPLPEDRSAEAASLIYDRHNAIARKFDLVYSLEDEEIALFDELGVRGLVDGATELPLPATYLIGSDRRVAYRFVDVDFRSRCCPENLLGELRALQASE